MFFALAVAIIIAIVLICSNNSDSIFFSEDETRINTDIVDSYTVLDKNGNSLIYDKDTEKFNSISNILSSAEVRHNKSDIFLLDDESSERIVLKGKNKDIVFIPWRDRLPDGSIVLVLKDFCKGSSMIYWLDNHDYLVTTLSENEYDEIFSNQ